MQSFKTSWQKTPRLARKLLVGTVGVAVVLAGIALLALPGPGWATIFVGLAILATEFDQADRLKTWLIGKFKHAKDAAGRKLKR